MATQEAYEPRRLARTRGDATVALASAREAIARNAADADAWEQAGHALARLARVEESGEAFVRCVAIDPARAGAHCGLGVLLLRATRLREAESALRRAIELDPATPRAQASLCWVLRRLGHIAEAIAAGRLAVRLAPDAEAYHYLAFALLAGDLPAEADAVCDAALALDRGDSAALAYKTTALAALGNREAGRQLADFQRLLWIANLPVPGGPAELARFNAELADTVRRFPRRPFDPTQTMDILADPQGPMKALRDIFEQAVSYYIANLPVDRSHPFLAARPERWEMEGWGTVMDEVDVLEHHFHQHGWLSGVYYALVPDFVGSAATGLAGCLEMCRFMQYSEQPLESEFAAIRPVPGLLVLFPSYFYHRIVPFRGGERISIAFNLIPA